MIDPTKPLPHITPEYFERAAEESKYYPQQWIRYLCKIITPRGNTLTQDEIDNLVASNKLTTYQKTTLTQASTPGTSMNRYIVDLNQKSKLPLLNAVKQKLREEDMDLT